MSQGFKEGRLAVSEVEDGPTFSSPGPLKQWNPSDPDPKDQSYYSQYAPVSASNVDSYHIFFPPVHSYYVAKLKVPTFSARTLKKQLNAHAPPPRRIFKAGPRGRSSRG